MTPQLSDRPRPHDDAVQTSPVASVEAFMATRPVADLEGLVTGASPRSFERDKSEGTDTCVRQEGTVTSQPIVAPISQSKATQVLAIENALAPSLGVTPSSWHTSSWSAKVGAIAAASSVAALSVVTGIDILNAASSILETWQGVFLGATLVAATVSATIFTAKTALDRLSGWFGAGTG